MLIRISLAQPARTVTRNEYFSNTFHCFYRPQFSRMVGNARQHIAYILPDAALLVGAGVDKNSFKSKAAGLEAVDLSLRTVAPRGVEFAEASPSPREQAQGESWYYGSWDSGVWSAFDYKELRDDRVIYFATYLWKGTYTATYLARATTAGTFFMPPAHAEEMYNPAVNGRTGGGEFVVTEPGR